jgi:feruloyl esterase
MKAAQRHPDDFDGIVAGSPGLDWTSRAARAVHVEKALQSNADARLQEPARQLLHGAVVAACDALDGVKDGVMDDPRQCKVDVAALSGLSGAQEAALKAIYAPTTVGGETVFAGQPFGGEGELAGWPVWISGAPPRPGRPPSPLRHAFGTQFFKYLVFDNPEWDYTKYDLSTWKSDTKRTASFLNATSPDLDAFKSKGRKLLLWHGWSDAGLSALGTIKYYEDVKARDAKVDDYLRMFMMPGVLHCSGGAGPDRVDWVAAIDAWVESGKPPGHILARKISNGVTTRTRPLCPYPQRAVYKGSGSTDEAENFVCRQP